MNYPLRNRNVLRIGILIKSREYCGRGRGFSTVLTDICSCFFAFACLLLLHVSLECDRPFVCRLSAGGRALARRRAAARMEPRTRPSWAGDMLYPT